METASPGLGWQRHDPNRLVTDGDEFLAAIAVVNNQLAKGDNEPIPYKWEYHHIWVACDVENYFDIKDINGDSWTVWGWDDIEWILPLPYKGLEPPEKKK